MALQESQWQNPLAGLLQGLLGQQNNNETNRTGTENTSGTDRTTRTGTNTRTGSSLTTNDADIADLQAVYKRQAAGITPEMLTAIFTEGQKKLPALTTSYANAVGARTGGNTPLATSISGLQADLTSQAAEMNNKLLADSSQTAARIAELTKSSNTTNNETGTTTDSTNLVRDMNTTSGGSQSSDTKTSFDPNALKALGLGAGGLSLLDTLLGGNGTTGGVNDLFSLITGKGGSGNNLGGILGQLLGLGNGKSTIPDGVAASPNDSLFDSLFGSGGLGGTGGDDMSWLDGLLGGGSSGPNDDLFNSLFGEGGDFFADFGFADGGQITAAMGADQQSGNQQMQMLQMLRKVMVLKQLSSSPKGQLMLTALKNRASGGSETGSGSDGGGGSGSPLGGAGTAISMISKLFGGGSGGIFGGAGTGAGAGAGAGSGAAAAGAGAGASGLGVLGPAAIAAFGIYTMLGDKKKRRKQIDAWDAANPGKDWYEERRKTEMARWENLGPEGRAAEQAAYDQAHVSTGAADGGAVGGDQEEDPEGIADTIDAKVSIGEYIHPKDVVDGVGIEFMEHLKDRYHVQADMQRAMGAGRQG